VPDPRDAEDILQDVFFELVEAYRLMKPVEQVTAWLFRVARNRIIDLFRRRQREAARTGLAAAPTEGDSLELEQLLPSPEAGPEAAYFRTALAEELDDALDELPDEQREVFVANELMGYTFQEIAKRTGVSINTLLSRKRYAVQHLRKRLQAIYDEFIGS
jgi:RNA polymerase sigma factor (sigma-70 family)